MRKKKEISWAIVPFLKDDLPVLSPTNRSVFFCPILKKQVKWEITNVYNPACLVKDGMIHMIYRADDSPSGEIDRYGNQLVTCRLGYAVSEDGVNFVRSGTPVLYPNKDKYFKYEWNGGCQDLHITEGEDGRYYMNYTAWTGSNDVDGSGNFKDTLMTAVSDDLLHWEKRGVALKREKNVNHTRSGVVVCRPVGDKLVAAKINGKYLMYYAHHGTLAVSDDLLNWEAVKDEQGNPRRLFPNFIPDSYADASCEAGAGAILTDKGIVYFFNAAQANGKEALPWSQGQALISAENGYTVLDYLKEPALTADRKWERRGHCGAPAIVCNTIVRFRGEWVMYYGATDHIIGRAVCSKRGEV